MRTKDTGKILFVVSKYVDQISVKKEWAALQTWDGKTPMYPNRFETEDEARKFIVQRAEKLLKDERLKYLKVERRLKRVLAKFGGGSE